MLFQNTSNRLITQFIKAMTLQQLEYILAIDEHRHFVRAAEACGITQSTLSSMLKKFEEEMDLTIFDRNAHPIKPTGAGENILRQARIVLYHANQLKEATLDERKRKQGVIRIGITPTIAPCIVPKLFCHVKQLEGVDIKVCEITRDQAIERVKCAQLDMAIMSVSHTIPNLMSIPLYTEHFVAYVSPNDPLFNQTTFNTTTMPMDRIWVLQHEISFQQQVELFGNLESGRRSIYESGNIPTLLHLVNETDGYTVLPELHVPLLRPDHKQYIRVFDDPVPSRVVSLFVRHDYVREGMLNIIRDAILKIIPAHMINEHLAKYPIKL